MFDIKIVVPGLLRLAKAVEQLVAHLTNRGPRIEGAKFVITVKDTQKAVGYNISGATVKDGKGHVVENAHLDYVVTSSDETVATVTPNPDDNSKGTWTFTGEEGPVTANVQVMFNGTVLGSFFENFQVTAGDPAAITDGTIAFDGLSEDAVNTSTPTTDTASTPATDTAPTIEPVPADSDSTP